LTKQKRITKKPRIEVDQEQFEALCRLNPTLKDAAAFFKCSIDTIEQRSKDFGYETFADARDKNMAHTRFRLIRKALHMAESGNTAMMIFALKNLCGWSDKFESNDVEGTERKIITTSEAVQIINADHFNIKTVSQDDGQ
jgi:phosphate-selective porin